jgi:hypothetical protein
VYIARALIATASFALLSLALAWPARAAPVARPRPDRDGLPAPARAQAGELVEITMECAGWLRGTVLSEPPRKGIFPASFVEITGDLEVEPP